MGQSLGGKGAPLSHAASVVVCTRNRGAELAWTLEALARHQARIGWEVVVVDNASDDETAEIARRVGAGSDRPWRLVHEPVLGLSAARDAGVRHASGEWVVFLDDDARPWDGWLDAYAAWFAEPTIDSLGGPVEPLWSGPLPDWLGPGLLPYLSAWDRGPEPVDLRYNELPRGANVAYRRSALGRVGGFDRRLGRRGRSLRSCEEIELGLRLERSGRRTLYVPGAGVRHRVETERLTPEWMERRFAAQGFSEAIVDWKHGGWERVREGAVRHARDARVAVDEEGAASLLARFRRAAARSYRRGVLYSIVAVERWDPPTRPAP